MFVYHIYLYYCLYLDLYVFFLYFITKVNCWNISNNHFFKKKKKKSFSRSPLTSCIPNFIKMSISLIVFLFSHNTTATYSLLLSLEMLRNDKRKLKYMATVLVYICTNTVIKMHFVQWVYKLICVKEKTRQSSSWTHISHMCSWRLRAQRRVPAIGIYT